MDARFCRFCKAPLPPGAKWCPRCGKPVQAGATGKGHPLLRTLALVFVAVMLYLALRHELASGEPADPHVARELLSGEGQVVLEIPGVLQVRYRDLGPRVELAVSAQGSPVVVIDENANHQVDAGDLSLQALPGDKVCAGSPMVTDTNPCGGTAHGARVHVTHGDPWTTATWNLPKDVLTHGQHFADVVFQVFHGDTQTAESYPGEPFAKVYRLLFLNAGERSENVPLRPESLKEALGATVTSPGPGAGSGAGLGAFTGEVMAPGAAPEIVQFEAAPASVAPGSPVRLQWSVRGAGEVTLAPKVGTVAPQGSMDVYPAASGKYVLTAKSSGGTVTREAEVDVASPNAPVITNFSADSPSLQPGEKTLLHWAAAGSISHMQLDPGGVAVATNGVQEVAPAQTTQYTLTVEGAGTSVSSKVTVRVAAPTAEPEAAVGAPVISFTAAPTTILAGQAVTLRWHVTGADAVTVEPVPGATGADGSELVRPAANTTYTLTARGKGGVSGRQVGVTVRAGFGPG